MNYRNLSPDGESIVTASSMELFHNEIIRLKENVEKKRHKNRFCRKCLPTFLGKIYFKKVPLGYNSSKILGELHAIKLTN